MLNYMQAQGLHLSTDALSYLLQEAGGYCKNMQCLQKLRDLGAEWPEAMIAFGDPQWDYDAYPCEMLAMWTNEAAAWAESQVSTGISLQVQSLRLLKRFAACCCSTIRFAFVTGLHVPCDWTTLRAAI